MQNVRGLADHLFTRVTADAREFIIDGQDALLDVGDHDTFGGTIEDVSQKT